MKFKKALLLLITICCCIMFGCTAYAVTPGTTYYVSSSSGNDNNDGLSPQTPWKTLGKTGTKTYSAGDKILLKKGDVFYEQLLISNSKGTKLNPITLSCYGTAADLPKVFRNGQREQECIVINDASGWVVENIEVGFAGIGLSFYYNDTYNNSSIIIRDCYFHDINGINQLNPIRDTRAYSYSAAIAIGGTASTIRGQNRPEDYIMIDDILITRCRAENAGSLLVNSGKDGITGLPNYWLNRSNLVITDCTAAGNAIYGIAITETMGGYVDNCKFIKNGSKPIQVGSAGIMLGNLWNYTVKNSEIAYQQRFDSDPDGCGIDLECRVYDTSIVNNNIHNNAGVGIMFYDNGRDLYNDRCVIDGNTFYYNNQNIDRPGGYEIYSNQPASSNNAIIRNNIYYRMSGIGFANTLASTAQLTNNTVREDDRVAGTQIKKWDFNTDTEGWAVTANDNAGILTGDFTGTDPFIMSPAGLGVNAAYCTHINLIMRNMSSATNAKIYFTRTTDSVWSESRCIEFAIVPNDSKFTQYTINTSQILNWNGVIDQIRIDVANNLQSAAGKFAVKSIEMSTLKTVKGWEFNNAGDLEGWRGVNAVQSLEVRNGALYGTASGTDVYLHSQDNLNIDLSTATHITMALSNPSGNTWTSYYFITDQNTQWVGNDNKRHIRPEPNKPEFIEYVTYMGDLGRWTGTLKTLRVDPIENNPGDTFAIDYIRLEKRGTLKKWIFSTSVEGWTTNTHIGNFRRESYKPIMDLAANQGCMNGTIVDSNAKIYSPDNLNITAGSKIRLKMSNSNNSQKIKLSYIKSNDAVWSRDKSLVFYADTSGIQSEYVLDLSSLPGFTGDIWQVRIEFDELVSTGNFSIDSITVEAKTN